MSIMGMTVDSENVVTSQTMTYPPRSKFETGWGMVGGMYR